MAMTMTAVVHPQTITISRAPGKTNKRKPLAKM